MDGEGRREKRERKTRVIWSRKMKERGRRNVTVYALGLTPPPNI